MPRKRTSKPPTTSKANVPLSQPDRTPDPTRETLISWAQSRNLFEKAPTSNKPSITTTTNSQPTSNSDHDDETIDEDEVYQVGRFAESVLWSVSLVMVHFTLDFLIQHQYAQEMDVGQLVWRCGQAFPVILTLFYILHPHPKPSIIPGLFPLNEEHDELFHLILFFIGAVGSGCYLIQITNLSPYYYVMKQAAPIGCVWIWSVVELSLLPAMASLLCCLAWLFWNDYKFL